MEPLAWLFALDGNRKAGEVLGLLPEWAAARDESNRPRRRWEEEDPDAWTALRLGSSDVTAMDAPSVGDCDDRLLADDEAA